jgi:hypothetical protein
MCSCTQKTLQATEVEPAVWAFVSGLLKDPKKIRAGMEALIEQERTTGSHAPAGEAEVWRQKIAECSRLRRAYQDQQAAGLMTVEELRERLEELENTRKLAQAELEALAEHEGCIKELEKDRDAPLQSMPEMAPSALEGLTGKEKNRLYRMLRLEVTPSSDEGYEISGAFRTPGLTPGRPPPPGAQRAPILRRARARRSRPGLLLLCPRGKNGSRSSPSQTAARICSRRPLLSATRC